MRQWLNAVEVQLGGVATYLSYCQKVISAWQLYTASQDRETDLQIARYEYYKHAGEGPTSVWDALGNRSDYSYDRKNKRLSETTRRTVGGVEREMITRSAYRGENLIGITDALGHHASVDYDRYQNPTSVIDKLGRETRYQYDDRGNLERVDYPDGGHERSEYDSLNRLAWTVDRAGRETHYRYDQVGRRVRTDLPDGTSTQTRYDAAGRVVASIDASGATTRYEYDALDRTTAVIAPDGSRTSYEFDRLGNQTAMVDAAGNRTGYHYDLKGRQIQVDYPDGSSTQMVYDARGRRVAEVDELGRITGFGYDDLGRLTSVIDPSGEETRYGYDEIGNQISQTDAEDRITTYQYDDLGRRISRTLPAGEQEQQAYDATGNVVSHTDFKGYRTTFTYDAAGRLLTRTPDSRTGEEQVRSVYDAVGRRTEMHDSSGTTYFDYDELGRLSAKRAAHGTLRYEYDALGRLERIEAFTSAEQPIATTRYAYDALGRLSAVYDAHDQLRARYAYQAVGTLASTTIGNGIVTEYRYDSRHRLQSQRSVTEGGTVQAGYVYGLDRCGYRISVNEEHSGRHVAYRYDRLGRLQQETIDVGGIASIRYGFDRVGNRIRRDIDDLPILDSQLFAYTLNDHLTNHVTDANGNTLIAGGKRFHYDAQNRLIGLNDGQLELTYDADGNLVGKTVDGVTTRYLVDTMNPTGYSQVIAEIKSDGSVVSYSYGLDLVSRHAGGATSWYLYDGHGSVRALADDAGVVTDTWDYDAYGNILARTGSTEQPYLYAGERFVAELGVYYNRARYYDQGTGRFLTQDTFEGDLVDPISLHKYLYCGASPIVFLDPTGLYSQSYGYAVEKEILAIYRKDHSGHDTARSGRWSKIGKYRIDPAYSLKPDILNYTTKKFGEIKPLSPSGIASGYAKLELYRLAFVGFGWTPDGEWVPSTNKVVVNGAPAIFVNVGGLVFYSDQTQMLREMLLISSAVSARAIIGQLGRLNAMALRAAVFGGRYVGLAGRAVVAQFQTIRAMMQLTISMGRGLI